MATGDDFKTVLRIKGLTQIEAADLFKVSRGTIVNYTKADEFDEEFIQLVQDKTGLNMNNLPNFQEQLLNIKNSQEPFLVAFIDIPAQAGYTKAYQNRDYIAALKKYPILPDVDPTGAVWRYFQIEGDSMEPEFKSGDIILASQVPKDDWTQFNDYHTYVVVTDTDLWIKDVFKESSQEWILLSQNDEHKPFRIPVSEVRQLWVMRRHIKNRAKKNKLYNIEAIKKQLNSGKQQKGLKDHPDLKFVNPSPFENLSEKSKKK